MNSRTQFSGRHDYEIPLLRLLCQLPEGQGKAREICRSFEREHSDQIPNNDYHTPEKAQQPRWEKHVNWCRYSLSKRGFVESPRHGVWRLTEQGRQWARENPDTDALLPVKAKKSGSQPAKTQPSSRTARGSRQAIPDGITLEMIEQTRRAMPAAQFRPVWGQVYDRLLAEERARVISNVTGEELSQRAQRKVDEIHAFLRGRSSGAAPKSEGVCDWIHLCYELELSREAASLLQYVVEDEVDPAIYRRAKRWAEASRVKLGW